MSSRNPGSFRPPDSRQGRESRNLVLEIVRSLGRFVVGQVLIAIIMTGLYAIGYFLVEVPLWWLAASLSGPLHLVPFLGTVVGAVIPVAFVLFANKSLWVVLYALLVFVAVQLFETLYLTPIILGRKLSLHPLVVFVAVFAGAVLGGPIGALVAAPVVAVGLLVWRYLREDQEGH